MAIDRGLLLQTEYRSRPVGLLVTFVSPAKTAEPVEMLYGGGLTRVSHNEPCITWGQGQTNPFAAARGHGGL